MMALLEVDGADSVFLSLASVASLLGRFHVCGGRSALLLSRRPGGALALGCPDCHTQVEGVRDELAPLLRRRAAQLQQALGLDGPAQDRLLAVLRGQQELVQQEQQPPPHHQQQQELHQQQQERHGSSDVHQQHQPQQQEGHGSIDTQQEHSGTSEFSRVQQEQQHSTHGSLQGQEQQAQNTLPAADGVAGEQKKPK